MRRRLAAWWFLGRGSVVNLNIMNLAWTALPIRSLSFFLIVFWTQFFMFWDLLFAEIILLTLERAWILFVVCCFWSLNYSSRTWTLTSQSHLFRCYAFWAFEFWTLEVIIIWVLDLLFSLLWLLIVQILKNILIAILSKVAVLFIVFCQMMDR